MPPPPQPPQTPSRSFWLLQKSRCSSADLSHTVICIFLSLGSFPYLSIHPVTPVIHLLFFSPLVYPPTVFSPPLSSPQWHREAHLNAQPVMSSLPAALGNFLKCRLSIYFTGIKKKCNHPFSFLIPSHNKSRWHGIAYMHEASGPAPPARAPFDISFTFMRLWLVHLVPSCSNSMQLAFQCSLSLACRKKRKRGAGEWIK